MRTWRIHNSGGWSVCDVVTTVLTVVARPGVAALASAAFDGSGVPEVEHSIKTMPITFSDENVLLMLAIDRLLVRGVILARLKGGAMGVCSETIVNPAKHWK